MPNSHAGDTRTEHTARATGRATPPRRTTAGAINAEAAGTAGASRNRPALNRRRGWPGMEEEP